MILSSVQSYFKKQLPELLSAWDCLSNCNDLFYASS